MRDIVFNSLKKWGISLKDKNVLICVSGGADSLALAEFTIQNKQQLEINEIYLCHFNHGTRKEENQAEQRLVERFCEQRNVKLFVGFGHMNERERPKRTSFELFARQLRYEYFALIASQTNAVVLTAHNLNDKAETFLLNAIRGGGISALRSIKANTKTAIRPLLDVSRETIELFCEEQGIEYATDSSNLSGDYSRNKIRLSVFPKLLEINQKALENISRLSDFSFEAEQYIDEKTKEFSNALDKGNKTFDRQGFLNETEFLQKQLLKQLLFLHSKNISEKIINLTLNAVVEQKTVQIEKHLFFVCQKQSFWFEQREQRDISYETKFRLQKTRINERYIALCEQKLFKKEEIPEKSLKFVYNNSIDCDKIVGDLCWRTRKPNDVFCSRRRKVTKTLKKMFIEKKLTSKEKSLYPVLADEVGVVWMFGEGVDQRVAIDDKTKSIININISLEV